MDTKVRLRPDKYKDGIDDPDRWAPCPLPSRLASLFFLCALWGRWGASTTPTGSMGLGLSRTVPLWSSVSRLSPVLHLCDHPTSIIPPYITSPQQLHSIALPWNLSRIPLSSLSPVACPAATLAASQGLSRQLTS